MAPKNDPWIDPAFEDLVRETAYFLWENGGQVHGQEQEYWFRSLEICLRRRNCDKALKAPVTLAEVAGGSLAGKDSSDASSSAVHSRFGLSRMASGPAARI